MSDEEKKGTLHDRYYPIIIDKVSGKWSLTTDLSEEELIRLIQQGTSIVVETGKK